MGRKRSQTVTKLKDNWLETNVRKWADKNKKEEHSRTLRTLA